MKKMPDWSKEKREAELSWLIQWLCVGRVVDTKAKNRIMAIITMALRKEEAK